MLLQKMLVFYVTLCYTFKYYYYRELKIMDPIKVDFSDSGKKKSVKEVLIPPEKAGLKIAINIILTLLAAVVIYYFMLPPMNPKAYEFYIYFASIFGVYVASAFLTSGAFAKPEYIPYARRQSIAPIAVVLVIGLVAGIGYLVSSPFFRAKDYSQILQFEESDDISDVITIISDTEEAFKNIPLIDKASAEALADKQLGDFAKLSAGYESQFELLTNDSTQINYHGVPYRVYPLQYADLFKWFLNSVVDTDEYEGIPGYVLVNMNSQEAELVTAYDIKYSTAEHFNEFLARKLRFEYPTYLFGEISFEVDEEGYPYWIVECLDKTIGLFGGEDVIGILKVDAQTGECVEYGLDELTADNSEISWIDQAYDADLLVKQYNYYGNYNGGFWNSLIGQSNVRKSSDGYSFLANEDDVYLYTGVTSVTGDQSILGFLLINQRTKDAYFYPTTGATEKSAQASANGKVSDKGWLATFPLLLNIDGEPTYFMSLKDSSQLVKTFAMVNVQQYSVVAISPNEDADLGDCLQAYISEMAKNGVELDISGNFEDIGNGTDSDNEPATGETVSGVLTDIRTQTVAGTTYYYLSFDNTVYYRVSASLNGEAVLFNIGDTITLTAATATEDTIIPADDAAFAAAAE